MGVFEDVKAAAKHQRLLKEEMPVYATITALNDVIDTLPDTKEHDQVTIELCILYTTPFAKGWHCILVDKATADVFDALKDDFDGLRGPALKPFIFRLTVWQAKKLERKGPSLRPIFPPPTNVSVDEMMLQFSERSAHTHRMNLKPTPEGYKVIALAAQGYCYTFEFVSRIEGSHVPRVSVQQEV